MRKSMFLALAAVIVLTATPAIAELQNVIVGGEVRIRGNYYSNVVTASRTPRPLWLDRIPAPATWGAGLLGQRSIGDLPYDPFQPGSAVRRPVGAPFPARGRNVVGMLGWNSRENSLDFVEHRTRLNVAADFTNEVSAFIELDAYDIWGEDFRSDYITGADWAGGANVEIYQSYIEANEMWGLPLRLRVGRQELSFGSGWLVGVNDTSSYFTGLSFDGVRATYGTDMFSVDVFATQLFEMGPAQSSGDVWFSGVYASYLGLEDIVLDAYWLWVRDPRTLRDTRLGWLGEWWEGVLGLDDYSTTHLNTVGLRGAGTFGAFDFEAEAAWQFGNADRVGFLFRSGTVYGDSDADFSTWAANLEVGYTFDMVWQPRVWLGGAYISGNDNRDIDFWEWLNPFSTLYPRASVSFNRLFSNWEYSEFLDQNGSLSNVWLVRGGIQAMPTETIELAAVVSYFEAIDAFEAPAHFTLWGRRFPIAGPFTFWTMRNSKGLGVETGLYATYHYSEDLTFSAGWAHLFSSSGLTDGQFVLNNGLGFTGGTRDRSADYLYLEARINF